ncbi:MAG: hypothetical protein Q9198_000300 [Flavoplaca austrocitrina]
MASEPNPHFKVPLPADFTLKPNDKEAQAWVDQAEQQVADYWWEFTQKVIKEYPNEFWMTGGLPKEDWLLESLEIGKHQWRVLVEAKYIELFAKAVVGWKATANEQNGKLLRAKAKKLMDELGIPVEGPI